MSAIVVDCSVVLATLAVDEADDYAGAALDHVARYGAIAPSLFFAEVANGLLTMVRRKRMTDAEMRRACAAAAALRVEMRPASHLGDAEALIELARSHNLTAYDAAYLDLALRERLPLATLDAELATAARAAGAAIFSP